MAFRRSDLQPALEVPGTFPFTVWGYGTSDPLDDVLRPGYVTSGRGVLALGDLIYVATRPARARPEAPARGETRAALVMVSGWTAGGGATLRLVQDFGSPDDPPAALAATPAAPPPAADDTPTPEDPPTPEPEPAPPKRKRGRPPKPRRPLTRL